MFPVSLDMTKLRVVVIGNGHEALRRVQMVRDAGGDPIHYEQPDADIEFSDVNVAFIGDQDAEITEMLYKKAKQSGVLVNAEDKRDFCDFHVPSIVRRGDLLLTSSTNGKSPAMAKRIREKLENDFDENWSEYLEEIANVRMQWRKDGLAFGELVQRSNAYIDEKGWFNE